MRGRPEGMARGGKKAKRRLCRRRRRRPSSPPVVQMIIIIDHAGGGVLRWQQRENPITEQEQWSRRGARTHAGGTRARRTHAHPLRTAAVVGVCKQRGRGEGRSGVWACGNLPSVRAQVSWSPGEAANKLAPVCFPGRPSEIVFALLTVRSPGAEENFWEWDSLSFDRVELICNSFLMNPPTHSSVLFPFQFHRDSASER